MRKLIIAVSFFGFASATVLAADSEFDMDFMQTVEDLTKEIVSNISGEDVAAVLANAKELDGMLSQVEVHYAKKGDTPDAVQISKDSRTLLGEVVGLASAKNFDAANSKSTELSRACKSCHKIYKKS